MEQNAVDFHLVSIFLGKDKGNCLLLSSYINIFCHYTQLF